MKTLYILSGFNNYYNRMVKLPGDTKEDYPQEIYTLDATNFVPNDGVNTEHVVGTYDYNGEGDYLLVTEMQQVPIDDKDPPTLVWKEIVVQRWFIIDSVRNRQGQYTLTLRRDLIADYYNIIAQSPMFIEKATVRDEDPAIYNNEGVSVNQIKTNEYALKDYSQSAWLVGYFNRDLEEKEILITYSNPTVDYTLAEGETFYEFLGKNVAYRLKSIELSFTYWINDYVSETYIQCRAILQKSLDAIHQWKIYTTGNTHPNPSGFIWGSGSTISSIISKQVEILNKTDIVKLINVSQMYINTGTIFQPKKCNEILKFSESVLQTYDKITKYQVIAAGTPSDYKVENVQNIDSINNVPAVKTYLTNVVTNE